jgi:membrane protease YdiL (CAAX protease family)
VLLSPPPAAGKGCTVLAWVAIGLMIALLVGSRLVPPTAATAERKSHTEERLGLVVLELQLRYLVGLNQLREQYPVLAAGTSPEELLTQARKMVGSGVEPGLCLAIVASELRGPQVALAQLRDLRNKVGASSNDELKQLYAILENVYQDCAVGRYDLPSVTPGKRLFLGERLGWFGELALHPHGPVRPAEVLAPAVGAAALALEPDQFSAPGRSAVLEPAERTYIVCSVASVVIVFAMVAGFLGLTAFLIWAYRRGLASGLECGLSSHGGVYAETFALWLIVYSALSFLATFLPEEVPVLARAGSAMLLSLCLLAWPVLRGIPWAQVRREIGWTAGRRAEPVEAAAGLVCYVVNLPLVLLGLLVTLALMVLQGLLFGGGGGEGENAMPTHPLFAYVLSPDWQQVLWIFLLASVIAPCVEETMFRGVLYRHLRELTCRLGRVPSMLISTLVVSFVFAVIHPQGLTAVPILMALAFGFCLAREWRGTLISSIFAHGLNNAAVTLFALGALSR